MTLRSFAEQYSLIILIVVVLLTAYAKFLYNAGKVFVEHVSDAWRFHKSVYPELESCPNCGETLYWEKVIEISERAPLRKVPRDDDGSYRLLYGEEETRSTVARIEPVICIHCGFKPPKQFGRFPSADATRGRTPPASAGPSEGL